MDWPKRKQDYVGLQVRTLVESTNWEKPLKNGGNGDYMTVPAGTVMVVVWAYANALTLRGARCLCCGCVPYLRSIHINYVELIDAPKVAIEEGPTEYEQRSMSAGIAIG